VALDCSDGEKQRGQLGQTARRRGTAGRGQRGVGKAAARQGRTRGSPPSGSGAVGHGTWPEQRRAGPRREETEEEGGR
jgi:hypothetical protein